MSLTYNNINWFIEFTLAGGEFLVKNKNCKTYLVSNKRVSWCDILGLGEFSYFCVGDLGESDFILWKASIKTDLR